MILLEGKPLAEKVLSSLKTHNVFCLGIIIMGEYPQSEIYVRNKMQKCQEYNIDVKLLRPKNKYELFGIIADWNKDTEITGIIVQLPLPGDIDKNEVANAIDPNKDVDCFHPLNLGKLMRKEHLFLPPTPNAICQILKFYDIPLREKHVVVIGRSILIGQPLYTMLTQLHDATVTMCHEYSGDLKRYTLTADIIVTAVGKKDFIREEMVREDSVIVDVGVTKVDGKIYGDCDFENIKNKVKAISPCKFGVGPVTISFLLENLYKAKNGN